MSIGFWGGISLLNPFEVKSYVFSFFTVEKDTRVGPMSVHSGICYLLFPHTLRHRQQLIRWVVLTVQVKSHTFSIISLKPYNFRTIVLLNKSAWAAADGLVLWVTIPADVHFCGFFQGLRLITVVIGFIGEEYLGIGFLVEIPTTDVGIPAAAV